MEVTTIDFLKAVLPELSSGQYYCSMFIGRSDLSNPVMRNMQQFHSSIEDLAYTVDNAPEGYWNTYYFTATTDSESRKKDAIVSRKAFFLDVDLKEYESKREAWEALQRFYVPLELPRPTIVDSGNGIHAYWILQEEIPIQEWVLVAERLKMLCAEAKFYADPAVTSDVTRIMRVPNTLNVKDPSNPKRTACAGIENPISLELFKSLIGYIERDSFDAVEYAIAVKDSINDSILGTASQHKSFLHGIQLSVQGVGCELLRIAYQHQEVMSEPQWRSALSIAQFCNDRDKAIHAISKRYSDYSYDETEKKAAGIEAPHTCTTFRDVFDRFDKDIPLHSSGKHYCEVCPHRKDIKSPITLCISQREARPEDNTIRTIDSFTGTHVTVTIPAESYPAPYIRGQDGGVYKQVRISPEVNEAPTLQELQGKLIYQYDLWVDSLQDDPILGEVVVMHLKQPRQELKRFAVPLNVVTSIAAFTDTLSTNGVSAPNYKELMEYVKAYVTKLQATTDKIKCPVSFGWEDNYTSFVLGSRRYLATGEIELCMPSKLTANASASYGMPNMTKVIGATDEDKADNMINTWKEIFKVHARPGQEARLFAVFASMGTPMFAFFENIEGVILHLTNKESGVGKTAIQHVANSIWGRPDKTTLMNLGDTKLSIFQHLGVLRHIPMCIDEVTMIDSDKLCQFCFSVTDGRGRHRMEASSNTMRTNVTEWRTIVITSGNNGLHQLMTQHKIIAEGEAMRVLELPVYADLELQTPKNKALTDKLFSTDLLSSYGVVGDKLLKYYVTNAAECRAELMRWREHIDARSGMSQRERFYSALFATVMLGAHVSKRLGLHDVDLNTFEDWVVQYAKDSVAAVRSSRMTMIDQLREYLHEQAPHTAVTTVVNGKLSVMQQPANGMVHVRHALQNKYIFISASHLKLWCTQRAVPFNVMEKTMQAEADGCITVAQLDTTSSVKVRCLRVCLNKIGLGEEHEG